jgi:hypothetical protein
METILDTPGPSQPWMTVTHPPLPSPRQFRGIIVAGCLVGALVFGGIVAGVVRRSDSSAPGVTSEPSSLKRAETADVGSATAAPLTQSGPAVPRRTTSWSPTSEAVVTSLIKDQPALAAYTPSCVLGVIESRFASPVAFADAARAGTPEFTSVAVDVVSAC